MDCIIVGSGISGLTTACRLLESGRTVLVVEQSAPAREASWAGAGLLSPLRPWRYPAPVVALSCWAQARYEALCGELLEVTGIDPEYKRGGLLILDPEDAAADAWIADFGRGAKLDSAAYRALAPGIAHLAAHGYWFDDVAQARNPRLLQALLARFFQLGGRLQQDCRVTGLIREGSKISGVQSNAGPICGGMVIICAGAWTSLLLEPVVPGLGIRPIRGQILLMAGHPEFLMPVLIHGSMYLVPRRDGRILVGSTTEDAGFDKSISSEVREQLLSAAIAVLPVLIEYQVEMHWSGLRPGSPQGIPYIGPVAGLEGLWLNAGHYRNGLVMAPGAAELLLAQIDGFAPPVDPAPFQVPATATC